MDSASYKPRNEMLFTITLAILFVFLTSFALVNPSLAEQLASPVASETVAGFGFGTAASGRVELSREEYDRLIEASRPKGPDPRPAPASFALGQASVKVDATARDDGSVSAVVEVTLSIRVFDEDWVLVPILPAGTSVAEAKVGGLDVRLMPSPIGLAWATKVAGDHSMTLRYHVDALRSEHGQSLAVPTPAASSIRLVARLPQPDLDVAVVPSAGQTRRISGGRTEVEATVPTTAAVQLAWREPREETYTISRASYRGRLEGETLSFDGTFDVEVFADGEVRLDLVRQHVTLREVLVDGESAAIILDGERFATLVRGRGRHSVSIGFQVRVARGDGPPTAQVDIPAVPVSRFDLDLPGKKEVASAQATSIDSKVVGGRTQATLYTPMCPRVVFSWTEAVPDQIATELRANASVYHAARAEEGVLFVRALVRYEISRGKTSVLRLEVPDSVQVERIVDLTDEQGTKIVADWRPDAVKDGVQPINVYLNRPLSGSLWLAVDFDRALASETALELPLLVAPEAQRQRGMIALLQGREWTLEPVDDDREGETPGVGTTGSGATRVGANQLPAFVSEQLDLPVAHTFKYIDPPELSVVPAVPVRQAGKFDAEVDTLISLGEVTLQSTATVAIDVKSGGIESLRLRLPAGVTLLGLTGPSIRTYDLVDSDAASQEIEVEFTQAMEGQFRIETRYEQILATDAESIAVPTVRVPAAEVEQGRIAVEALAAVEVQAAGFEHLSVVDPSELPRQLVLRTSNPILLAFKYVRAEPRPSLDLAVERHKLLGVQEAVIDSARYTTLVTKGGMRVTTARFEVRNSRKQFLRLAMPANAKVWSVFVDGQPETPALADDSAAGEGRATSEVLIKIKNATEGFPVEVVFESTGAALGSLGTLESTLPQPDILVTETHWDVFVPADLRWGTPRTSLEAAGPGTPTSSEEMRQSMSASGDDSRPLVIDVPTAGVRFSFAKLYANRESEAPSLRIGYASRRGATIGSALNLLGGIAVWSSIAMLVLTASHVRRRAAAAVGLLGMALVGVMVGVFKVSTGPLVVVSLIALVAILAAAGVRWWRRQRDEALEF